MGFPFAAVSFFLALNVVFTPVLWAGSLLFPAVPLVHLPLWLNFASLGLLIFLPVLHSLTLRFGQARWVFLASAAVLVCLDQTRLQPWFYQYVISLFVLWGISRRLENAAPLRAAAIATTLGAIYFWSGCQKLNVTFYTEGIDWFIAPLHDRSAAAAIRNVFMAAAPIEIILGLLHWTRMRKSAAAGAIVMHAFLLLLLGPLGRSWNSAVWPWNLAMIALNAYLFRSGSPERVAFAEVLRLSRSARLILAAFVTLPALSFFGKWDLYLSFALYSWNTPHAYFEFADRADVSLIPSELQVLVEKDQANPTLNFLSWGIAELNVPPPPEERLYRSIAAHICDWTNNRGTLVIQGRPEILSGNFETSRISCLDLLPSMKPG